MSTLNVVCLYWGNKYSVDYVVKLRNMVERHLKTPHRFICITDNPDKIPKSIETMQLPDHGLTGWWNKLLLFDNKIWNFEGRVLFLDLDIVIMNDLDRYVNYNSAADFNIIDDFYFSKREYNSSVMIFNPDKMGYIWDSFDKAMTSQMHGDQNWITKCLGYSETRTFPTEWTLSFKKDKNRITADTSIVVFHGKPDPHEVDADWIKLNWC